MSITVTTTVFCKEHPNYKGIRRSQGKRACWGCDDVYIMRNPKSSLECEVEKVEVHSA